MPEPKMKLKSEKVIYYLHGGAYAFGHSNIYRHLTGDIVKQTGCYLFALNYRLAPEHPFPVNLYCRIQIL